MKSYGIEIDKGILLSGLVGCGKTSLFYGKDLNVMGEVLLSRYEHYQQTKHKIKTHATTNFNAEELEERYGNRVRSRKRELLIQFLLVVKVSIREYNFIDLVITEKRKK